MICSVNSFADDLQPDQGCESDNSASYVCLVADMIDVVLAQSDDLSLNRVQAEAMALQFLREAIPNIECDAQMFGILPTIESARTTSELTVAAGQLRLLAEAISAREGCE